MGKSAHGILRATLLGVALFGFSLTTSAQQSLALESSLLGSDILESTALSSDIQSVVRKVEGKTMRERADIKATEIVRKGITGSFTSGDIKMEIESVEKIEGGVQVFARAWRDGQPIGFGADGTVEIERFLIYNPPILVPDEGGSVVRTHEYEERGETKEVKYREDPKAALIETLAHTMKVGGQDGVGIVKGKRGNTTRTFYSIAAGDGSISTNDGNFADNRAGTGTFFGVNTSATSQNFYEDTNYAMRALYFPFDTSPIESGETIASSTFSLYGDAVGQNSPARGVGLLQSNQASSTTLTTADWVPASYTEIATRKNIANLATGAYNDYAVTNLSVIAKGSGFTKLMILNGPIIDNDSVNGSWYFNFYMGDQGGVGTTQDPTLVVVSSMAATVPTGLLANGQTNPTALSGTAPEFSAVYNDPDSSDVATSYRIQVATTSGFTDLYWDSGKTTLASSTPQGTRIADIIYGGSALAASTTYYWRIKFWDDSNVEGAWSTETATFSLYSVAKVRKSVNESLVNSTTLQSDDQLRIGLSANSTYIVDGIVFASSTSVTPDITVGFSVPSGAILTIGYTNDADQEVLAANATSSRIAIQANIPKSIHYKGTIKTSGSGGDITLQWAQATVSAAATTVMQGSYMRVDSI